MSLLDQLVGDHFGRQREAAARAQAGRELTARALLEKAHDPTLSDDEHTHVYSQVHQLLGAGKGKSQAANPLAHIIGMLAHHDHAASGVPPESTSRPPVTHTVDDYAAPSPSDAGAVQTAAAQPYVSTMPQLPTASSVPQRAGVDVRTDEATRERVARPLDFAVKRYEQDLIDPRAVDTNGRLASVGSGAAHGAAEGFRRRGVLGAAVGAIAGAIKGGADPASDERRAQDRGTQRDAATAASLFGTANAKADLADRRSQVALRDAQTQNALSRPDLEAGKTLAREKKAAQDRILSTFRLLKAQGVKLDPTIPAHAQLLADAFQNGITGIDVGSWNSGKSNFISFERVDPDEPTQKQRVIFNAGTGETTTLGQSGYVAPVHSATEMTTAQELAAANAKERIRLAADGAQLQHDKFMYEVNNGIPASAKRAFDVQTQPLQKELTSLLAEIKSWQQRAEANAIMPDVAERHVAELKSRVAVLQEQIGAARTKALGVVRPSRSSLPRRAPAPASGYSEADVRARARRAGRDEDAAVKAARAAGIIK